MATFTHPKDGGVEAPISLGGLFTGADSDEDSNDGFRLEYSTQAISLCDISLQIRQYSWHMANANKVWPGTFSLANFLFAHKARYDGYPMLELGAATGALSIFLKKLSPSFDITTSDINDEGDVEENVKYNFVHNGLDIVPHIPHTWGQEWPLSINDKETNEEQCIVDISSFRYIIASDILLYVR